MIKEHKKIQHNGNLNSRQLLSNEYCGGVYQYDSIDTWMWSYWHKKQGHVNHKLLHILGSKEIVCGISHSRKERLLCGNYQEGKQTRAKHTQVGDIITTHVLEFFT